MHTRSSRPEIFVPLSHLAASKLAWREDTDAEMGVRWRGGLLLTSKGTKEG
jgi:hypothetical protein